MIEKTILIGIGIAGAICYLLYRSFGRKVDADYEREIQELLTREEFKVKGRFEN